MTMGSSIRYYSRSFTPQPPVIQYLDPSEDFTCEIKSPSGKHNYLKDIKLRVSNLEGAENLYIQTYGYGQIPLGKTKINNFRKGYFNVTIDEDFPTDLTVISTNTNGSQVGNSIHIEPSSYTQDDITLSLTGNKIIVNGIPQRVLQSGTIKYSLYLLKDVSGTAYLGLDGILKSNEIELPSYTTTFGTLQLIREGKLLKSFKLGFSLDL